MKRFLLVSFIVGISACAFLGPPIPKSRHITSKDLDRLAITNISAFWQGRKPEAKHADPSGVLLKSQEGYICGKTWDWIKPYDTKSRTIGISVFESKSKAVAAMEWRFQNVAARSISGPDDGTFPGRWWRGFSDAFLVVNYRNCNIEVCLLNGARYSNCERLLKETATSVISQIDTAFWLAVSNAIILALSIIFLLFKALRTFIRRKGQPSFER